MNDSTISIHWHAERFSTFGRIVRDYSASDKRNAVRLAAFIFLEPRQPALHVHTYIHMYTREIQELVEAFTREASVSRRLGIVSRVALAAFLYPSCAASRVSRDQADSPVGFATTWRMLICSIPREKCSQIERERKRASQRLFRRVNFKNVIPILLSCFILYYINRRERNMFKIFEDSCNQLEHLMKIRLLNCDLFLERE